MYTIEKIKEIIVSEHISILYLNFVDLQGKIRTKGIFAGELLKNFDGFFHDGISVTGNLKDSHSEESDFFIVRPIPESFMIANWILDGEDKVAYILCELINTTLDSRAVVKRITKKLNELQLKPMAGLGITYKVNNQINEVKPAGFYECFPGGEIEQFNSGLASTLLQSGIDLEYYVPSGPNTCHLAFVTKPLLQSMDNNAIGKWVTTSYAALKKKNIEFIKPFENSAPIHISIWDDKEKNNLFYDPNSKYELSAKGYSFISGILHYFDELIAIIAGSNGSLPALDYKKKFSYIDDNSIISAPCYFFENGKMARSGWSKRCIFRGIDNNANLYLVSSCIFAAGLDGILHNYPIEKSVDEKYGVYSSSLKEKNRKLNCCDLFNELLGENIMESIDKQLSLIINNK